MAHVNGSPDGVVTAVKRIVDRPVNTGSDCMNAMLMYHMLSATDVKMKHCLISAILIDDANRLLEYANAEEYW